MARLHSGSPETETAPINLALRAHRFLAHPLLRIATFIMMFYIIGCVSVHPLEAGQPTLARAVNLSDIDDYTLVLTSEMMNSEGRYYSKCGAVLIGENVVATAWHCVVGSGAWCRDSIIDAPRACTSNDTMPKYIIYYYHHHDYAPETVRLERRIAHIIDADPAADLAILRTDDRWNDWARLGEAQQGEWARGVGHPSNNLYTHARAQVIEHGARYRYGWSRGTDRYVVDYLVGFGMSGGGLWNSRGQLIGICLSRNERTGTSNYVTSDQIQELIGE